MIKKLGLKLLLVILLLAPLTVLAGASDIIPQLPNNVLPGTGNETLGGEILGYIMLFLQIIGLIAVAVVMWGGFQYVTSAGDPKKVELAKGRITNALIGLVIIILSYVIVNVVTNAAFGQVDQNQQQQNNNNELPMF